jgi:hypothetical protein
MHLYSNAKTVGINWNARFVETPIMRDYEWRCCCEQPARNVLAVRLDLSKNGDQEIKETDL